MKKLTLDEFQSAGYEDWKRLALKELRDQPFDTLVWKNENGFEIEPYYSTSQTSTSHLRSKKDVWQICQTIADTDIKIANAKALQALNGGASAIRFKANITTQNDLNALLNEIGIAYISTHFLANSNAEALQLLQWLAAYCNNKAIDTNALNGSIDNDAVRAIDDIESCKQVIAFAKEHFASFKIFTVNATNVHNRGGNASQDIAYALSVGNEFLHVATEAGFSVDEAATMLQFNFATDASYFIEIAKYRVFRNLWAAVVGEYKPSKESSKQAFIHAETSSFLQTTRDAYNNLLRATTQAMSAAIGMADSIEVICHDEAFASPSEISLRLARNVQHLLIEESYLTGNEDFASGSHYQEAIAKELTNSSWNLFLEIEKQGGIRKAANYLNDLIEQSAAAKKQAVQDGKRVVVGVNKYINKNEADLEGSTNRLT